MPPLQVCLYMVRVRIKRFYIIEIRRGSSLISYFLPLYFLLLCALCAGRLVILMLMLISTFHCNTVSFLANMKQSIATLILIIFSSSWAQRVSAVDCNGYYGYDTNFECKWMEAVDLLVPAAWIAAVGIFLLALTVSKDV